MYYTKTYVHPLVDICNRDNILCEYNLGPKKRKTT
jgi:hypothetical protein